MRNNVAAGGSFNFRLMRDATASLWLFPWSQVRKSKGLQRILEARSCLGSTDSLSKNYLDYLLIGDTWTHFLLRCFSSFLAVYRQGCRHDDLTLARLRIKTFRAKQNLLLIGYGDRPGLTTAADLTAWNYKPMGLSVNQFRR
jgi:hypothetical protein